MARSIWTGAISFGLVNVPVKLYSAVSSKSVRFHQLNREDHARVKQRRVSAATGEEVAFEDIVKGYEIGPDRYVIITPDELEAMNPKATRTIDIEDFVDGADIDPIYFDHSYYLAPGTGAAKSYRLLVDAMRQSGKVAIAKVVLRQKQYLCALRATDDGVMVMSTLNYGDEIVPPDAIDELDAASETETSDRELKMAQQLIDSLSAEWDPAKFSDTYREQVLEMIERKAAGEEVLVESPTEEAEPVPDLMAALEASLAAVKSGSSDKPKRPKSTPAKSKSKSKSKA